jgi:hypothetical protein
MPSDCQQTAQRRAEQAGRTGIDQHQLAARVDQEAVDRGFSGLCSYTLASAASVFALAA